MRRREFITLASSAAGAWPLVARAQQSGHVRRIGLLTPLAESDAEGQARLRALRQGLETLGWIEGRNLEVDYQWANDADHSGAAAAKLVEHAPDIIVVNGIVMLTALKRATQSVPIVFVQVPDPVRDGFVASLAHPGGNITGFTNFEYALGGKWLDLLREIAPGLARVAIIQNPGDQDSSEYLGAVKAAARRIGLQAISDDARDDTDIERIIGALAGQPNSGLIVLPGAFTFGNRCVGGSTPPPRRLSLPVFHRWRRSHVVRHRDGRPLLACGVIRRPHPQGREASRSAGAGTH
jgi:putative ABC transport system substrate-binding protein